MDNKITILKPLLDFLKEKKYEYKLSIVGIERNPDSALVEVSFRREGY
jgi:predicted secreted protein